MNEFELLESLSKYTIEFGIFDAEGNQVANVDILNTDDSITTILMKVSEIMYLTEYGTMTIPGTFVLDKSLYQIDGFLTNELEKIVDDIFDEKIKSENDINNRFDILCLRIEDRVKNYMQVIITNTNKLSNIINEKDDNKYLYDMNKLSKYIKCRYFKHN